METLKVVLVMLGIGLVGALVVLLFAAVPGAIVWLLLKGLLPAFGCAAPAFTPVLCGVWLLFFVRGVLVKVKVSKR